MEGPGRNALKDSIHIWHLVEADGEQVGDVIETPISARTTHRDTNKRPNRALSYISKGSCWAMQKLSHTGGIYFVFQHNSICCRIIVARQQLPRAAANHTRL